MCSVVVVSLMKNVNDVNETTAKYSKWMHLFFYYQKYVKSLAYIVIPHPTPVDPDLNPHYLRMLSVQLSLKTLWEGILMTSR